MAQTISGAPTNPMASSSTSEPRIQSAVAF